MRKFIEENGAQNINYKHLAQELNSGRTTKHVREKIIYSPDFLKKDNQKMDESED